MRLRALLHPRHPVRDIVGIVISLLLILIGALSVWAATLPLPDVASIGNREVSQSTKIYDRTGTVLLYDLNKDTDRTIVTLDAIAPMVAKATIAIEDADFYQHGGIRVSSIVRALLADLVPGGQTQGGSTITQQVVKNALLTRDRTITRKLKEWILAVRLEKVLPKDKILEIYLNESPYGGAIYGVEAAAETYFGVRANAIDLAQSAYLAALPQSPTYYSPYGAHRKAFDARKDLVLSRMKELDMITADEYTRAKNEHVDFLPQAAGGIRAPHFVFYVEDQLTREFGATALLDNSWKVITSLDATMQDQAEQSVADFADQNLKNFKASNEALVALDPTDGDILAMVGSKNYFATDIDGQYNVATSLPGRQPGSAFKPFVYAQAFVDGYTPDTVLFDVPTQFSTEVGCNPQDNYQDTPPCYAPQDYDNKFRGPMTIRNALAQSINIPAIKALYLVGIQNAINLARSLGISTLTNPDQYGLTLVLGGGEVTLLDMTSAYGVFANQGVRTPPRAILSVQDQSGNVVKQYDPSPTRVVDQNVALQISDVLSDHEAKLPAYGAGAPVFFPGYHVADKTGTTNDTKDAWIIGYTPHIAVGAWAGNNDDTPMVKQVAGLIIVPMWHDFLAKVLATRSDEPFPQPQETTTSSDKPVLRGIWEGTDVQSDPLTGKLKITANVHDILNWVDKADPRGPVPTNPSNDPQFTRWEYGVQQWAATHGIMSGMTLYH